MQEPSCGTVLWEARLAHAWLLFAGLVARVMGDLAQAEKLEGEPHKFFTLLVAHLQDEAHPVK